MTKKELFAQTVRHAIHSFNNSVTPEIQERLALAAKIRSFAVSAEIETSDEKLQRIADVLYEHGLGSVDYRNLWTGTLPRKISAFLIFKATDNSNGHKYGASWVFCRGPESRNPFLLSPISDYCGQARNNICEPEYWVTPDESEIDDVINMAWSIYIEKETPFRDYVNMYMAPLEFLITEEEQPAVTVTPESVPFEDESEEQ